ncbi:MAG: glycoside hydrolase family 3 N-terminal domain-containing protein, partial [Bacteroidia bacterium]
SNPANPVIHMRSFGESKYDVADKAIQYTLGLQNQGIIAVAKHFPGHGDTYLDSHLELPKVEHSRRRINRVDLYPFERVFNSGIAATMSAHLNVPAFMGSDQGPASLSKKVTTKLLRRGLDFEGLVFSDALNMKAVTKHVAESEIDIEAFKAGNDILLFPATIEKSIEKIKLAICKGEISETLLNQKVLRILQAKYWIKKNRTKNDSVLTASVLNDSLNAKNYELINYQIAEQCGTQLNKVQSADFKNLHDTLLLVVVKNSSNNILSQTLNKYAPVKTISVDSFNTLRNPKRFKKVVVALYNANPYKVSSNFNYDKKIHIFPNECSMASYRK